MNVAILLVTHSDIGRTLLESVKTTYEELPLIADVISVPYNGDPNQLLPQLKDKIQQLDQGNGVLILTDVFGSTPCNLTRKLSQDDNILIVTGLNMPMLLRVMNYPDLGLEELSQKAVSGGLDGIVCCQCEGK